MFHTSILNVKSDRPARLNLKIFPTEILKLPDESTYRTIEATEDESFNYIDVQFYD